MTNRPTNRRGRSRFDRTLRGLAAAALMLPLAIAAAPGSAAADPSGVTITEIPDDVAGVVTLLTGDRVTLEPGSSGRVAVTVDPASRSDGVQPEFTVLEDNGDTFVFPSDTSPLLDRTLDRQLFNVTKLADYGYTDGVPIVVTNALVLTAAAPEGMAIGKRLPSVGGYAGKVADNGRWWAWMRAGQATTRLQPIPQKIWLDDLLTISLDKSVPMIGAPQAWSLGFDGKGETVAVLDTGIDLNHPDLAGKIVAAKNFTTDADTVDRHGHGTHVAGTIAGSGAGSNGLYKGVAPGASLLIGKICNSSGTCPTSATIAAMEWAAPQAGIVSMSIGTNVGNDGTSPTAQAINELSATYPNTLFVVAAGNNGSQGQGSIASPGSADAALTVGAVDKSGNLAAFSGRGPRLGDFAIKPDVTAPGVAIVAPRAAGTSMGAPVNTLYTAASGTSMATPHVAGAVAIARQHHPELTGQQIKAKFIATADPNPDLSVFEQGGGLINIPAALDATVLASPEPLNVGFFAYPQSDDPVTEKPVTYMNTGDAAVTLNLALDVADDNGTALPATALSVSPTTLTIPAGATATATVRLDSAAVAAGSYGGSLTATAGEQAVRVPVGFTIEPPMAQLTVNGITRDGRPADYRSSLYVVRADDPAGGYETLRFNSGVATGRFLPGVYTVVGSVRTMDGGDQYMQDRTMVANPTVRLDKDTTLIFDARQAKPVTVDTPDHPNSTPLGQQAKTIVAYGGNTDETNFAPQYIGPWVPTFVLKSGPAEVSGLELVQQIRLADAKLAMSVVSPSPRELFINSLAGSPEIDGATDLELAYVGAGSDADYAGVDAQGKAVLVLRTGRENQYGTIEATARAHGARALIVMNNTTGYPFGSVGSAARIPSMTVSGQDGEQLRAQLLDGKVVVRVSGNSWSPYLYDLALLRTGSMPDGLHETVRSSDHVRVDNAFHGEPNESMSEYRALWRPYLTFSAQQYSPVKGARTRTEYVTAATNSLYRQLVARQWPGKSPQQERDTTYPSATRISHEWFGGVLRPIVLDPIGSRNPGFPIIRSGDSVTVRIPEWADSSSTEHYGSRDSSTDTTPFSVYLNGKLLGSATMPMVKVSGLPAGEATLRFDLATTRNASWWQTSTKTRTSWTVQTKRASQPALLPMMTVDYDTDVDLTNTAITPSRRGGPATLDLHVHHQAGFTAAQVAGAKVWISYDDGATWELRPTKVLAGAGNFRAVLDSPDAPDTPTGYASVKVQAWDSAGNTIEQSIIRAWRLATR